MPKGLRKTAQTWDLKDELDKMEVETFVHFRQRGLMSMISAR